MPAQFLEKFLGHLGPMLDSLGMSAAERDRGLRELELGAIAVGAEVMTAELRGVALAQAVRDAGQFPRLLQLHVGVEDLLRGDLPQELQPLLDHVAAIPTGAIARLPVAALAEDLVKLAARGEGPAGAIGRFTLFQFLRIGRLVATWRDTPTLCLHGLDDEALDRLVEQNMLREIETLRARGAKQNDPIALALASTLHDADALLRMASRSLSKLSHGVRAPFEARAKVEDVLLDAPAVETLMVRNTLAPTWHEARLPVPMLVEQHPLVLGGWGQGRVDQRQARTIRALKAGQPLPARRTALIDVLIRLTERAVGA
jgi:hypothetical protein